MKKLHKLIAFLGSLILVLCFTGCFTSKAQAAQNVLDQAGILDHSTVHYIDQLNDNELSKIKGHPQLVVVTKKSLDDTGFDSIDDYGQYLFDKYHFGRAGYDNGVLLLVILDPHGFRMQTGYGAESVLPDNYVHTLMSPEVKDLFRHNDYNQGIKIMADKAVNRMQTHASDFRSKSEVNIHQAAVLREEKEEQKQEAEAIRDLRHAIVMIFGLALLIGFGYLIYYFFASRAEAKQREQEEVARKEREAKEAAELKKQRKENAKLAKQFDEQAKNAKLSSDDQQAMTNMDNDDKAEIMKKVLAGALIGGLITSWCDDYRARKRLEEERRREDEEAWERFRANNYASNDYDETSNTHHSHHNNDDDDDDNDWHHHNWHHHDDDGGWGGGSSSDNWSSNSSFSNDDDDDDSWGGFGGFGGSDDDDFGGFGGSDDDDFGGFGGFSGGGGGDDSW